MFTKIFNVKTFLCQTIQFNRSTQNQSGATSPSLSEPESDGI